VTIGTLTAENYAFKFVNGTLNCLKTIHVYLFVLRLNNFGSTPNPQSATSLWVNVAIKIRRTVENHHGRYLSYTKGSITLKDINATDRYTDLPITTKEIPNGQVMADSAVKNASQIYTQYDLIAKSWVTHVPLSFSSTSDIYIFQELSLTLRMVL
jgi:hypothetical protein